MWKRRANIPLPKWISFISELKIPATHFLSITSTFTTTYASLITTTPIVVFASTSIVVTSTMEGVPPPPLPACPTKYAPLVLPPQLHGLPQGYSTRIKTFGGEEGITAEQHVDQFNDFIDLVEVDDKDVKMRLFVHSFIGEVRKWFKTLTPRRIHDWNRLEDTFLRKWGSKVNHVQALNEYNNLRKESNESVKYFTKMFNKVYNSITSHIKPPPRVAQLHCVEAFDYEFSIFLRERESATLVDMENGVGKVEINIATTKR